MNPEFLRYVWTELSIYRTSVMSLTLLLLYGSIGMWGSAEVLMTSALLLSFIFGMIAGGGSVSRSITEEINKRTWDWKRMSPVSPWTLVLGKLYGAPLSLWFGLVISLATFALAAACRHGHDNFDWMQALLETIVAILFTHACVFICELDRLESRLPTRSSNSAFILIFAISVGIFWAAQFVSRQGDSAFAVWCGMDIPLRKFILFSVLSFYLWLLIGSYRLMRRELQYKNRPTVYFSFLVFVWFYIYGFGRPGESWAAESPVTFAILIALAITICAGYAMLLVEPISPPKLRRMVDHLKTGMIARALYFVPRWLISVSVVGILLIGLLAASLKEGVTPPTTVIASIAFFFLRDTAIFFLTRVQRGHRESFFALFLVIAYGLLPAFTGAWSGSNGRPNSPVFYASAESGTWVIPMVEALALWAVCYFLAKARRREIVR